MAKKSTGDKIALVLSCTYSGADESVPAGETVLVDADEASRLDDLGVIVFEGTAQELAGIEGGDEAGADADAADTLNGGAV